MPSLLAAGKKAPSFSLTDKDGARISLKEIETDYTVIYFYPKDSTPGCTIEAKSFSKDLRTFEKMGVTVIGISGGDDKTKEKFCRKEKLSVTLLSDTDFSVAKKYGAYGEKTFMGKKFLGIFRSTFLLDAEKKIIKVYEKVSPETHSAEVIEDIKTIAKASKKK